MPSGLQDSCFAEIETLVPVNLGTAKPVVVDLNHCAICGKPFKDAEKNDLFKAPGGGYRHRECSVGTPQYRRKFGNSELQELMEAHMPTIKADVPLADIKNIVGRVKFMLAQDKARKEPIGKGWSLEFTLMNGIDVVVYHGRVLSIPAKGLPAEPIETLPKRLNTLLNPNTTTTDRPTGVIEECQE
jgi:hypothetical protein